MAKVKITGIDGLEGEHELDLDYFTNRELHTLKQLTGIRGSELIEALDLRDNDLNVGLAMVAVNRKGFHPPADLLWEAQVGQIKLVFTDEEATAAEDDASPPDSAQKSEPSAESESSKTDASSGNDSPESSDPLESDPSPTGPPGSDTGSQDSPPPS